jgi:glycosyltransferase involved in cell wall biosynthesis
VAPVGVDEIFLPPGSGEAFRKKHGLSGKVVLFLGRKEEYKGYHLITGTAATWDQKSIPAHFVFIGPDSEKSRVGLTDAERFNCLNLGWQDEAVKHQALDASDILCLPSKSEILPVSILEAWQLGKPVLAGNIANLRWLVENAGGGWITDFTADAVREKIRFALSHPAEARAAGERGAAAVREKYRNQTVIDTLEELYKSFFLNCH